MFIYACPSLDIRKAATKMITQNWQELVPPMDATIKSGKEAKRTS